MMDKDRLRELEELCADATPGPWTYHEGEQTVYLPGDLESDPVVMLDGDYSPGETEANLSLIATARTALPDLLAYVRELEKDYQVRGEFLWNACQRIGHLEGELKDAQSRAEMACEEPCGGCAGCQIAEERQGQI